MSVPVNSEHRRALIIGAAGLGLVLVLFVVSRLLAGGDDFSAPPSPPVPTTVAPGLPPAASPDVDDDLPPIPELPDSFEYLELRDPFESPLLVAAIRRVRAAPPPPAPGSPGLPPAEPGPTPDQPDEQRVDPTAPGGRVTLAAIESEAGRPVAVGTVDGHGFRAAEGERFGPAGVFEVVHIDTAQRCVLFRRGDEPFTECVGRGVVVK